MAKYNVNQKGSVMQLTFSRSGPIIPTQFFVGEKKKVVISIMQRTHTVD
jgi:hypothetical protein